MGGDRSTRSPRNAKTSESFAQLAAEYSLVVLSISRCSRLHIAALVGAMLTLPEHQGKKGRPEPPGKMLSKFEGESRLALLIQFTVAVTCH
jgi:hypothetical protein